MDRREFIKTMTVAAAGTALSGIARAEDRPRNDDRPNILLIMTDDQREGLTSASGNPSLKTPAMDSLARDGIRFERAYCANPVCVPSRMSMATGIMPGRLGAFSNKTGLRIPEIPDDVVEHSLGMMIRQAGYDTFHGGKTHMGNDLDPRVAGYNTIHPSGRGDMSAACLAFMRRERDRPFFAVASFINPHDICYAYSAAEGERRMPSVDRLYRQASALPLDQLPPLPENHAIQQNEPSAITDRANPKALTPPITMRGKYDEKEWRIHRWIYCRLVEDVDRDIGVILNGLRDAGLEDNTLIVFTSDNGQMDASHRLASKGQFYEESARVPFFMKHKGVIPSGRTDDEHLVSIGLDILPTLCDYARIEPPADRLGRSLRRIAEGKPVNAWRDYVVCENAWGRMLRTDQFKYCVYDRGDDRESLVDMQNDPGEMRNVAGDPPFKHALDRHRRLFKDWVRTSGDAEGADYVWNGPWG